jgi:hypothetical protein
MPIQHACDGCGFTAPVPDDMAGREVLCPKCGKEAVVLGFIPVDRPTLPHSPRVAAPPGRKPARSGMLGVVLGCGALACIAMVFLAFVVYLATPHGQKGVGAFADGFRDGFRGQ